MKGTLIAGGVLISALVLPVLHRGAGHGSDASAAASRPTSSSSLSIENGGRGFLYGRVTTDDGAAYVGRLRFGRNEEAFWGDYFNGSKATIHGPLT